MEQLHFNFDYHSQLCREDKKYFNNLTQRLLCEMNKKEMVIFIRNRFVILTYNKCAYHNHIDFAEVIVKKVHEDSKTKELINVERSVHIGEEFKENRLRGTKFNTYSEEVHYMYHDATGKEFAITSKLNYVDYFLNRYDLDEKIKTLYNYIDDESNLIKNKENLKQNAEELLNNNYIIPPTPIESFKKIDNLIKQIKKEL